MKIRKDSTFLSAYRLKIEKEYGLFFPEERIEELQKRTEDAAAEMEGCDGKECISLFLADQLAAGPKEILLSHLTVGETYFFREAGSLQAFLDHILPERISWCRKKRRDRLRIWSAGCATGEEAFTLASLIHFFAQGREVPPVEIWATDINVRALRKAQLGTYTEWSFRQAPVWLKAGYFDPLPSHRYRIRREIQDMVSFSPLNLVLDNYAISGTELRSMDCIFCRNVLMYFSPEALRKVTDRLRSCLDEGGFLVVSPSEASHIHDSQLRILGLPDATLFQKVEAGPGKPDPARPPVPFPHSPAPAAVAHGRKKSSRSPIPVAESGERCPQPSISSEDDWSSRVEQLCRQGCLEEARQKLLSHLELHPKDGKAASVLARVLANQGNLSGAQEWCERALSLDKLDATSCYLLAAIFREKGQPALASPVLKRLLFFQPEHVLAHYTLANIARAEGKDKEAARHYSNALRLLERYGREEILPESDGLTARQIRELIGTESRRS